MFKRNNNTDLQKNSAKSTTIIAHGTIFKGDISSNDSLRVDGEIVGDVECSERVIVGPEGKINGHIRAKEVLVGGLVKGNIQTWELLVIKAKARVEGDIETKMLTIESEAVFAGNCCMDSEKVKDENKESTFKRVKNILAKEMVN